MTADKPWEHFDHQADIGVRGFGRSKAEAFANAAVALTAVISAADKIEAKESVHIHCAAARDGVLLVDWLNALVFEMMTRRLLLSRFDVSIERGVLEATA
jgi:SHS2 domain-containing protein